MREERADEIVNGLKDGIPIGLGYFSVSFSFGIIAVASGLKWSEALLISMTNLTSAGQFAGVTIICSVGTYIEMALTQLVINLRYALMSVSLSQKVDDGFNQKWRAVLGFGITDEIYAVAMGSEEAVKRKYFFGLLIAPYIGWTLGTLFGAVFGSIMPDMVSNALGVALYGMFIAVVVPKAKSDRKILTVVLLTIAISLAIKYIPVFSGVSSGFSIIICAVLASAAGALLYPIHTEEVQ